MPRRVISQTNFTSGQLSERLFSQSGLSQYNNGLRKALNCLVTPQGPIKKRPGTFMIDYAKDIFESTTVGEDTSANPIPINLIPFKTTTGINYMLEFGNDYIRVFRDGGIITDTNLTITNITAANPAVVTSASHGLSNGELITITGVSGMVEINNDIFKVANVTTNTFELESPTPTSSDFSTASYTAYTSGGTASQAFQITTTYEDTDQLQYAQEGNKLYLTHPDHPPAILEYTGGNTGWSLYDLEAFPPPTEELGHQPATTVTPGATSGTSVTFTAGASAFQKGDEGRQIVNLAGAGRAAITSYTSGTSVTCTIVEDFPSTSAIAAGDWELDLSPIADLTPSGTKIGSIITLDADEINTTTALNTFRSGDVGKYILIQGGIVQLTEYVSASQVKGEVLKSLDALDETSIWTMEEPTWNNTRGYPSALAFYEDRLWFGGTTVEPSTIWASETSLYDAFGIGANDDDAISVQINSSKTSVIKWLAGSRDLVCGTDSSEITINSGSQGPITPSSIRQTPRTYTGSANHVPVIIDNEVLYLQDDKVRSFRYDFNIDNFRAEDLTYLSNDLFKGKTLKKIIFAQTPDSVIYVLTTDGTLFAGTFVREQKVIGWTQFKTAGQYIDIQVLSGDISDEVWCAVRRVNRKVGLSESWPWMRTIERFDSQTDEESDAAYSDCALKLNSLIYDKSNIYAINKSPGEAGNTTTPPTSITLRFHDDLSAAGLVATSTYSILIENCPQYPALEGIWTATYSDTSYEHLIIYGTQNNFSSEKNWAFINSNGRDESRFIYNIDSIKVVILSATTLYGLQHLPNYDVNIRADGAEFPSQNIPTISSSTSGTPYGYITFDTAVHQAVVGIPYTMEIETLPLDIGEGGTQSLQNRTSRRVDVLLRVHDSAIPTVNGSNIADRDPATPMGVTQPLVGGILNYGPQDWSSESTISITDSSPLPILVNGIYSIVEVNRKA